MMLFRWAGFFLRATQSPLCLNACSLELWHVRCCRHLVKINMDFPAPSVAQSLLPFLHPHAHSFSNSFSLPDSFTPLAPSLCPLWTLLLDFICSHDLDYIVGVCVWVCACVFCVLFICVWCATKPGPHAPLWPVSTKEMPCRPKHVLFTMKCSYSSKAFLPFLRADHQGVGSSSQVHSLNHL